VSRLPQLEDLGPLGGARVLVRLDLNVPLATDAAGNRRVRDDFRIRAALPTLRWLLEQGAEVTACTHLGRPANEPDPRYTVEPVRAVLDSLLPGVRLLENLRFSPGETGNDPAFVAQLIEGQDVFVNDAFGVSHRAHASVVGPPVFLPSAAGRLLSLEVSELGGLIGEPARPFVVVIGGAKVADKIGLLKVLAAKADRVLIGGGMAFTFTRALGESSGDSLLDEARIDECKEMLEEHDSLVLPVDFVAAGPGVELQLGGGSHDGAAGIGDGAPVEVVGRAIPDGWMGCDIGPATAQLFASEVVQAATILWNGPMGVFEDPRFAEGTRRVAEAVAAASGRTVVGGGDSVAALNQMGLADRIDHISTGGGASLEFLEHGDLPGLAALRAAAARAASPGNEVAH
jgi:phosphoglycerate kinase